MTVTSTGVDPSNTYSGEYLTFEALEDGRFQFTNHIQYSLDGGTGNYLIHLGWTVTT